MFCWPCIIMYHSSITNLIHFRFHKHFIVSKSSTCFGRQASIFRRHYTSSFWYKLHAVVAVGWLQVVAHNFQPANSYKYTQLTPKTASVVPPEDGRLTSLWCDKLPDYGQPLKWTLPHISRSTVTYVIPLTVNCSIILLMMGTEGVQKVPKTCRDLVIKPKYYCCIVLDIHIRIYNNDIQVAATAYIFHKPDCLKVTCL
jgi:hypothetical protein